MTEVLAVALVVSWIAVAVLAVKLRKATQQKELPAADVCHHIWGPWTDPAEHAGGTWTQRRRCEICNLHEDRSWSELRGRAYTAEEWERIDRAVDVAVNHMKNCRQVEGRKPD